MHRRAAQHPGDPRRRLLDQLGQRRDPFRVHPRRRGRDRDAGTRPAGVIGDRRAEAAQADLHLLVVQRPALRAHLVQRLAQRRRRGDGVGREAGQAAADERIQLGVRQMRQQHLAQGRRVRRRALADEGVHADQPGAVHRLHADRLVVVQDADMHGLAGFPRQVLQRRQRLPAELLMAHRGRAQRVEAHGEGIAAGLGVLLQEPERLDRVQDAEYRRLGLPELGGEFGQAPAFLPGEAVDHRESLVQGAEQVGVAGWVVGVSHSGSRCRISVTPYRIAESRRWQWQDTLTAGQSLEKPVWPNGLRVGAAGGIRRGNET
jgi:hypothetical protein